MTPHTRSSLSAAAALAAACAVLAVVLRRGELALGLLCLAVALLAAASA